MAKKWRDLFNSLSPERRARVEARVEETLKDMRAKLYQELRDELFTKEQQITKEQQMENEASDKGIIRTSLQVRNDIRPITTLPTTPAELEEAFKTFLGKFNREGDNLRMELVTNITGMRFVAVFNWDDMG